MLFSRLRPFTVAFVLTQLLTTTLAQSGRSSTPTETSSVASRTRYQSRSITSSRYTTPTSTPSSSAGPSTHTVTVGNNNFKFEPAELRDVKEGDIVTFEFYPPDHSVARAEFGSACVPFENTGKGKVGFFSTTQLLEDPNHPTTWNLTVNSTEPIFFYCAAPKSCMEHLMVGVINPNETQTLEKQIEAAKDADFEVAPGGKTPSEGSHPGGSQPHKLSGGAIAGIVVGGVAVLVIAAALFFFIVRAKSLKKSLNRKEATVAKPNGYDGEDIPISPYSNSPFSPLHSEYSGGTAYSQHHSMQSAHSQPGWSDPHQQHLSLTIPATGQPSMAENHHDSRYYYTPYDPVELQNAQLGVHTQVQPHRQSSSAELYADPSRPNGYY